MEIAGVYLAAGKSSRMGRNKLTLPIGTKFLGSMALETAIHASFTKIYCIVTESDDLNWMTPSQLEHPKCVILRCPDAHKGQSESLRCGILQAKRDEMSAALILLADMPFVTVQMLEEMIACMKEQNDCSFVATSIKEMITPPVLVSNTLFDELLTIHGDIGARRLLEKRIQSGKLIPCKDERFVFDIDTPEDYDHFKVNSCQGSDSNV
ncbi:NTP transferase domain-containing protein [Sporosarcina sp. HYO08]|uniref:nucleotidyltransferase family protein n=1 Tax=Sporosarcina sp. HYO08 TaxID=1759557 RepID=UPI000793CC93|nr:nucleotidyltransferase family protein [Sporosarcina sp. HYO08]KXH81748.1 hypothetical protein AU377_05645 [Sporosarcina sp. HYO08]